MAYDYRRMLDYLYLMRAWRREALTRDAGQVRSSPRSQTELARARTAKRAGQQPETHHSDRARCAGHRHRATDPLSLHRDSIPHHGQSEDRGERQEDGGHDSAEAPSAER